jgi:thioredoxin
MSDNPDCETFSEENFQEEVGNSELPVLVVFEADWSGTCHIMTPILEDLCVEFRGHVRIGMVDIDANRGLVERYGISSIPSLVFFKNGEIVDHISGSAPKHMIVTSLNNLARATGE